MALNCDQRSTIAEITVTEITVTPISRPGVTEIPAVHRLREALYAGPADGRSS
jgi:hypothetical protein